MTATSDKTSKLLDIQALAKWLDSSGISSNDSLTAKPLTGGQSNALFELRQGKNHWVLRRPNRVAVPRAAEGIKREYAILKALHPTPVPVAEPIALCEEESVLGTVFLITSFVGGFLPVAKLPADFQNHKAELTMAVVDALVELHKVDYKAVGLADFGKPEGFHLRQRQRWSKQLESYEGREIPELEAAGRWIEQNAPEEFLPTVMHADYHMMNLLIRPSAPPEVAAILDWETATIGDPLLDLAGFLEVWCPTHSGNDWPAEKELIQRYKDKMPELEFEDLRYYRVLYNYRLAILLEGIYQRSLKDPIRQNAKMAGERALYNARRTADIINS